MKIPALLSGCIQRSMNDWLRTNVSTVSTANVATAPICRVRPGFALRRPTASAAVAVARATRTAVRNGTLPTSTQ